VMLNVLSPSRFTYCRVFTRCFFKRSSNKSFITNNITTSDLGLDKELIFGGLDINTKTTGYTFLNVEGDLICCGYLDKTETNEAMDKAKIARKRLEEIVSEIKLKLPKDKYKGIKFVIGIEDYLKNFDVVTDSLFTLARINNFIAYECFNLFQSKPIMIHPNAARSFLMKLGKGKLEGNLTTKEAVFQMVSPLINYEWIKNKRGTLKDVNYDISDSYVIAHSACKQHIQMQLLNNQKKLEDFKVHYNSTPNRDKGKWLETKKPTKKKGRTKRKGGARESFSSLFKFDKKMGG